MSGQTSGVTRRPHDLLVKVGMRRATCSPASWAARQATRTAMLLWVLVSATLACTRDTAPQPAARVSVRDSIRVRRERAMATRPDTFGQRVDSLRVLRAGGPSGGSAGARPWVVVISDFQCDECRRFARDVVPALRRDVERAGIANLAFVNAPQEVHFNARFAALAALCAASTGHFWAMHDTLFATQDRWARDPDPRAFMDSLAVAAGVPADVQHDCVSRNRLLHLLDADVRRSAQSGATDLPAVFVGERLLPARERTLDGVRRAIAAATPAPPSSAPPAGAPR